MRQHKDPKLMTIMQGRGIGSALVAAKRTTEGADLFLAMGHDARLAHEMLPVLRQLAEALRGAMVYLPEGESWGSEGDAALEAAAPFLEA